jgi:hypothetical protein
MRWEDERYVRIFTRDTSDLAAMGWEARALLWELFRKMDRAGILKMGKSGIRGLSALVGIPIDVVTRGLDILTDDGVISRNGDTLFAKNFQPAQECTKSDRLRQQERRDRDRYGQISQNVTNGHDTVTERHEKTEAVTSRHDPSRDVTPYRTVPCSAVPNQSDSSEVSENLAEPASPPEPALLTFPCSKGESWDLTESVRSELAQAYPAVDVMACARRALEWCRSNPKRVKSRGRMRGWIGTTWCSRAQDNAGQPALPMFRSQQRPQVTYPTLPGARQ